MDQEFFHGEKVCFMPIDLLPVKEVLVIPSFISCTAEMSKNPRPTISPSSKNLTLNTYSIRLTYYMRLSMTAVALSIMLIGIFI
jgi:hypothetical protein